MDTVILRLSDSFEPDHRSEADIEVKVRMLNVNFGHNGELMNACRPLFEYSWLINEIRKNQKKHTLKKSIDLAIQALPDNFGIKDFVSRHKAEVEGMLDTEYNESEVRELFMKEAREEAREDDITDMLRRGKTVEEIVEFCGYPYDQVKKWKIVCLRQPQSDKLS